MGGRCDQRTTCSAIRRQAITNKAVAFAHGRSRRVGELITRSEIFSPITDVVAVSHHGLLSATPQTGKTKMAADARALVRCPGRKPFERSTFVLSDQHKRCL